MAMFPSVSLNHAVLAPPPVAMLFLIAMHSYFLEHDAPRLEFGHLRFDIADLPVARLAGLGGPRVARGVHEHFGASAFVNHAPRVFRLRRESSYFFVRSSSRCL